MKIEITDVSPRNQKTAQKILEGFRIILDALMNPDKQDSVKKRFNELVAFAQSDDSNSKPLKKTVKIPYKPIVTRSVTNTEHRSEMPGFGEKLGLGAKQNR